MGKRIASYIVLGTIVLALVLVPCLVDSSFGGLTSHLIVYIVSKVAFGLAFIVSFIVLLFRRPADGLLFILVGIGGFFQLFPLFIRIDLIYDKSFPLVVSSLLLIFGFAFYILMLVGLMISNQKMNKSDNRFQSSEIEIQDEKRIND